MPDPKRIMQSHPLPSPWQAPPRSGAQRWTLEQIDFSRTNVGAVHDVDHLFYLVVTASFIESGSDTYTRNLVAHFADWPEIADWLEHQWQPEELQHGRALRTYVETVWPEFDWPAAYAAFFDEYSRLCTVDELEDDRTLELVARCVVETGTATYYETLRDLAVDPVLADLAERIRADEVRHYKYFFRYFKRLREARGTTRLQVVGALRRRLIELRDSDTDVALRHAWQHRPHADAGDGPPLDQVANQLYQLLGALLPLDQAVKMLLRPVELPHRLEHLIEKPIARLARRVLAA